MDGMTDFESVGRRPTYRSVPGFLGGVLNEIVLGVCWIRTRLCEGRSLGSIPSEGI